MYVERESTKNNIVKNEKVTVVPPPHIKGRIWYLALETLNRVD